MVVGGQAWSVDWGGYNNIDQRKMKNKNPFFVAGKEKKKLKEMTREKNVKEMVKTILWTLRRGFLSMRTFLFG